MNIIKKYRIWKIISIKYTYKIYIININIKRIVQPTKSDDTNLKFQIDKMQETNAKL